MFLGGTAVVEVPPKANLEKFLAATSGLTVVTSSLRILLRVVEFGLIKNENGGNHDLIARGWDFR